MKTKPITITKHKHVTDLMQKAESLVKKTQKVSANHYSCFKPPTKSCCYFLNILYSKHSIAKEHATKYNFLKP